MLEILTVLLLLAAVILFWLAGRRRRSSGLPAGRIVYRDTGGWGKVEKPLYDPISGLTGKPDYLVNENGMLIPVEVKSMRAPRLPHDSHVFQLAAYCLLVERTYGKRPPYGLIHYRDKTVSLDYSPDLQREMESILNAIRIQDRRGEADRSHNVAARCARCGYRAYCNQRL